MKKGFISMTIIYSFLLIFIFTLLALLVLYTQKSRLVDTIVYQAKDKIEEKIYSDAIAKCFTVVNSTITDYKCSDENVKIPTRINGVKITAIGDEAFYHKGIDSVLIPSTIVTIGESAFEDNLLEILTIPNSVTTIGDYAFAENSISNIIFETDADRGIQSIGGRAFARNELWILEIPSTVRNIHSQAFIDNKLESVTIKGKSYPDDFETYYGNETWGWASGYDSSYIIWEGRPASPTTDPSLFTTTVSGDYVTITGYNIGSATYTVNFDICKNQIEDVLYDNGFETQSWNSLCTSGNGKDNDNEGWTLSKYLVAGVIPSSAYSTCGISNISIGRNSSDIIIPQVIDGKTVTTIAERAFYANKLTSITFPNTITTIGQSSFRRNELTSVVIPNSVSSIGNYAFYDNQLSSVVIKERNNSSQFSTYGTDIWGWASGVTCVKNNTSNVTNGCITWGV